MKYLLCTLMISFFSLPPSPNRQAFGDFHIFFKDRDFTRLSDLLTDDFKLVQDGKVTSKKAEYVLYMLDWNKALDTKWNVVSTEESGGIIKSIEYDSDIFNDYFYGDKMKLRYTYSFSNHKIKTLNVDTLPGTAKLYAEFDKRFGAFYQWVSALYPDNVKYLQMRDRTAAINIKSMLEKYLVTVKLH